MKIKLGMNKLLQKGVIGLLALNLLIEEVLVNLLDTLEEKDIEK